ncbi:MAG: EAL domain-containing protein, partial [Gammaproteobacteria bacterium]|nr:EAL domain-containing protein [Gammaproteobacteria bacterium]
SEAELEHLATHDALTDLPNGRLLQARLEHAINRAERHGHKLAVLMLDIDRFKDINDSLGFNVGDALLKEMAQQVVNCLWKSDTVARLGGDELVIMIEELTDPGHALQVAKKIRDALRAPYTVEGQHYFLTVSIGISLYPDNGNKPELLVREADAAVYRAKEEGRNRTAFYTESLSRMALERLSIEAGLRYALEHNELELHYQPQLLLQNRKLAGVEGLVRWRHPEKGLIPPDDFIPLAEKTGLIEAIGEWVLEEACRQMAAWRDSSIAVPRISVNLSAHQLGRQDLVQAVEKTLELHGLEPEMLELELTETAIMEDPQKATETLKAMAELGVAMAVDDFGTGYSSLAYLQRLHLHRLKIDRTFVQDLPGNANNVALCRAIIAMASSLGMETIAEGIEKEEQHAFLSAESCTIGQGWLYARALPAAELEQWLAQQVAKDS